MTRRKRPKATENQLNLVEGIANQRGAAGEGSITEETLSEITVTVHKNRDVEVVRTKAKALALAVGIVDREVPFIATAASILARNIVGYASPGQITMKAVCQAARHGVVVMARYEGPDIPEVDMAMQNRSTGLSSVKRLMDEFSITSYIEEKTEVVMMKWMRVP